MATDALDLDAWKTSLACWAKGLNLDDELDRYVFQKRVQINTMATRPTLLHEVCRALIGGDDIPLTHEATVQRIADAWISLSTTRARKPARPGVSVGDSRAAVAAALRRCADELGALGDTGAAAYLRDRADTHERAMNGDDR